MEGEFTFAEAPCTVCDDVSSLGSRPECVLCRPGSVRCREGVPQTCDDGGNVWEPGPRCESACVPDVGCTSCVPGSRRCEGERSMVCTADGARWVEGRDCAQWGSACGMDGFCEDACATPEREHDRVGCEYYAATLPHSDFRDGGLELFDFRVALGSAVDETATVRITQGDELIAETTVEPGGLQLVSLPRVPWVGQSESIADAAYRIVSDQPISVTQFDPFEYWTFEVQDPLVQRPRFGSYTNDASLLLPRHVLTETYRAVSFRGHAYVAVVGVGPEPTTIHVQPHPHAEVRTFERSAIRGGEWWEFTLRQGEIAVIAGTTGLDNVGADGQPLSVIDADSGGVTGVAIQADHPVAAFGGNMCAHVTSYGACEHLETQLLPTEMWGRSYVGAPLVDPGVLGRARNVVRIVANEADTAVTLYDGDWTYRRVLGPGDGWDAWTTGPYTVNSSRPVSVAQFMEGQLIGQDRATHR